MGFYNVTEFSYPSQGFTEYRIFSHGVKTGYLREKTNKIDTEFIDEEPEYILELKHDRSVRESAKRSKQTIYQFARANIWEYFVTLTFDRSIVDSSVYDCVAKYVGTYLHNLRRVAPNLKYLFVPELHSDGIHYHVHGLVADCSDIAFIDSGHVDATKNIIYNMPSYHGGFSTATKVKDVSKVSSYITKYITKSLTFSLKGKRRFWASKNLNKPIIKQYNLETDIVKQSILSNNVIYVKTVLCPQSGNIIQYLQVHD